MQGVYSPFSHALLVQAANLYISIRLLVLLLPTKLLATRLNTKVCWYTETTLI